MKNFLFGVDKWEWEHQTEWESLKVKESRVMMPSHWLLWFLSNMHLGKISPSLGGVRECRVGWEREARWCLPLSFNTSTPSTATGNSTTTCRWLFEKHPSYCKQQTKHTHTHQCRVEPGAWADRFHGFHCGAEVALVAIVPPGWPEPALGAGSS